MARMAAVAMAASLGQVVPAEGPDGRAAPERGRGGQAADRQSFPQDHAAAEKADAADDLRRHLRRIGAVDERSPQQDVQRGAAADQGVGPQSGRMLAELPFQADEQTQPQGGT